jgi:hypothetical protein
MTAPECLGVKPDAGGAVKRPSGLVPGQVIGMEFVDKVRTLALQAIPGLFPHVFKDMIERGAGDDHAAGATTVA